MTSHNDPHIILGTGPLGLAVMDALLERNHTDITLVNRSSRLDESLPAGVKLVRGDATDPDTVARICEGAAVVFHCAQPAYTDWPEKFPPITQGILEGVSRTGAKLVFGDNLYMYGSVDGPIHEDLPYAATTRKGRTRAQMAKMLLDAHQAGKVQVAIGRGSDFFGPRVLDAANVGEMLFGAALEGKTANMLGDIDQPHTYTYIKDFGRALVILAEHDKAFGEAWHVPNAETVTTRQFVKKVEKEIGRPIKTRSGGRLMIALLGLFVPMIREQKEMMYEFEEPFVVDDSKFTETFDTDPTPLDEAIRETVAWYRQHHTAADV